MKKKIAKITKWWGLGVLVLMGVALDFSGLTTIRSKLESNWMPLVNQIDQPIINFIEMSKYLVTWPVQVRQLALMRQELGLELSSINQLDALKTENEALRIALGFINNDQLNHQSPLLAQPLASYAQPMINIGREDGVRVGMLVSSLDGVWLGRISQVSARVSQVTLLTSRQSEPILAEVSQESQGLVKGLGNYLIFTNSPQINELKVGQRVLSVGQQGVPAKKLIGVISAIETLPTDAVQTARIDQLQDFYQVSMVAVYD